MLGEATSLALRGRMAVDTYFRYRLFDPKLSAEAKARYLSEAPRANAQLWSLLTPKRYRCLYDNKLIFNRYFASFQIPLATIFGVFDPLVGSTIEGSSLRNETELAELIRHRRNDGFVFKPAEGMRGHMVLVLAGAAEDDPETFLTLSGQRYNAAALVAATRDTSALEVQNPGANLSPFLVEERIRPHPELARFIGPTLCTVRVLTVIGRDGTPQIVASVFKLQTKPVGVDHLMYGALGCWVDPETGALGPGRTRATYEFASVMPDTDRSFVGFKLPCWPEVKAVALRAAAAFPGPERSGGTSPFRTGARS